MSKFWMKHTVKKLSVTQYSATDSGTNRYVYGIFETATGTEGYFSQQRAVYIRIKTGRNRERFLNYR